MCLPIHFTAEPSDYSFESMIPPPLMANVASFSGKSGLKETYNILIRCCIIVVQNQFTTVLLEKYLSANIY